LMVNGVRAFASLGMSDGTVAVFVPASRLCLRK
jgi:hypothetical protein